MKQRKRNFWAMAVILSLLLAVFSPGLGVLRAEDDEAEALEVWCWDPSFNIYAMEQAEKIYAAEHPDFRLKITEISYGDIVMKLAAAIAGGQKHTLPDIMLMADVNLQKYLSIYQNEDIFLPLDDSEIDFSQFAPYKVEAGSLDGKIYTVPFDAGTAVGVYREDLLEKGGLSYEDLSGKSWDELIELYTDVQDEIGVPLLVDRSDGNQMLNCMLSSAGQWYFDEDGQVSIKDNEAMRLTFETYKKAVDAGVVARASDSESYYGSFYNGSVVGAVNACWILSTLKKEESLAGKWRITDIPRLDPIEGAVNAGNNGGSSWVVCRSDKSDLAIDFLKETFAGNVDFYNEILPDTGAIATWLPAKDGSNYQEPQAYFGDQPIFKFILEQTALVPRVQYGLYTTEASDAVKTALADYLAGADLDAVLEDAESSVAFLMGQ